MRTIWTIAKKEYDQYFNSPIAYVVAFMLLFVVGLIFALNLYSYIQNAFQLGGQTPDISPVTGSFVFMLMLSVPAITMRLVSDENRMGTIELLLTAPVRDSELIIGKWLGGFLFILSVAAVTLIYPLILSRLVQPFDWRVMLSSYLGLILVASALLGLGVGISALFENQIAAFFATMSLFVFLWWLIGFPANILPAYGDVFRYLGLTSHFYNTFDSGKILLGDIVYYISLTALGLFTGTAAVEMRRWR